MNGKPVEKLGEVFKLRAQTHAFETEHEAINERYEESRQTQVPKRTVVPSIVLTQG